MARDGLSVFFLPTEIARDGHSVDRAAARDGAAVAAVKLPVKAKAKSVGSTPVTGSLKVIV